MDQLFEDNVRFFAARLDGVAVGCGGVAFYDGFAEVKRMFTRPTARRQGVAAALLERLEGEARGAGRSVLRLETGMYQAEAIGFYERAGFERCAAFGDYLDISPQADRDQRLLREVDLARGASRRRPHDSHDVKRR